MNHEIVNKGTEVKKDVYLLQPVYPQFKGMALPQKDGVVVGTEAAIPFIDYIKDKEISENWFFVKGNQGDTTGLTWPEIANGRKDEWRFGVEYKVEELQPDEEICFGPVAVGINTSRTWRHWREFIVGEDAPELKEQPLYALQTADGDVISSVGHTVEYSFRSMLTPYVHGSLRLNSEGVNYDGAAKKEDEVTKIDLQVEHRSPGIKRVNGSFRAPGQIAVLESIQLVKGRTEVLVENSDGNWSVDNGALSFKASPAYFPGIYSLTVNGQEALHNQYPEAGPKAWWNPWGGGIRYYFQNVSPYSMMKENTKVEPVSRIDQNGHTWKGLCLTTEFTKHETMKGTTLKQYALTLPEVPVLACYGEILQNSGRTFKGELLDLEAFFKPGNELTSCFAKVPSEGVVEKYFAGIEEFMLGDTEYVTVGSEDWESKITFIHSASRRLSELYMNQEVFVTASTEEWSASTGETYTTKPTILLIGEEEYSETVNRFKEITFR